MAYLELYFWIGESRELKSITKLTPVNDFQKAGKLLRFVTQETEAFQCRTSLVPPNVTAFYDLSRIE
jgi:hypothetical protein